MGVVLTHSDSDEREYNVSGKQVALMAEMHAEVGDHFVTAIVSLAETEDEEKFVNFEAFQLSDQCVSLHKDGWIKQEQTPENEEKMGSLQVNNDVIVVGKDTREIDTDFLLVAVPILDHQVNAYCLHVICPARFRLSIVVARYWTRKDISVPYSLIVPFSYPPQGHSLIERTGSNFRPNHAKK